MYLLEGTSAFESVVNALETAINTNTMFTNLGALIPVVGGVLIFSFTYRIVRKIVSGSSKGKAKI